jgi:hypothetical protein
MTFNQWKFYDTKSPNFGLNFGAPTSSNFGAPTSSNFGAPTSSNFGAPTSSNVFNFVKPLITNVDVDSLNQKKLTTNWGFTPTTPQYCTIATQTERSKDDLHLVSINLPKNKIEGLLNMVNLEFKYQDWDIQNIIDNILNPVKLSTEELWFMSFIKYSNKSFISNKVDENLISFTFLYSNVLRSLMIEKIKTPQDLYTTLNNFAKIKRNKKMLWLFTMLEFARKQLANILDETNILEMFVLALDTFIEYDNEPFEAINRCLKSTSTLYKICLLSLIGASYGVLPGYSNSEIAKLTNKIICLTQDQDA